MEAGITTASDILLLAFNKNAAKELRKRIQDKCRLDIEARTFHSFGLGILGEATNAKPSLSKLAENDDDLRIFIQSVLITIAADPGTAGKLSRFLALLLTPYYTVANFEDRKDYLRYKRALKNRTLKGEQVKSQEEMLIANWLFLNGVKYEYETSYEHDTRDSRHRQYMPDFYLPDNAIYIEHYGIDKSGDTAPGIQKWQYLDRKTWHE